MDVQRAVPAEDHMQPHGAVFDSVRLGVSRQVRAVGDLLQIEPLACQGLEAVLFALRFLAQRLHASADVAQLGVLGDERLESESPKRPAVVCVRDQRDDRHQFSSVGNDGAGIGQRVAEQVMAFRPAPLSLPRDAAGGLEVGGVHGR